MFFSITSALLVKSCSLSTESLKPTTAASQIEVRDLLRGAVVGHLKIALLQAVNHFAAGVAHCHGSGYQSNLDFNVAFGNLLHLHAGFGRKRPGSGLGANG